MHTTALERGHYGCEILIQFIGRGHRMSLHLSCLFVLVVPVIGFAVSSLMSLMSLNILLTVQ